MLEDYRRWKDLDYVPASRDVVPTPLRGRVRSGQRALDVGCHHGAATRFLASLGLQVLGIDINPRSLQVARQPQPETTPYLPEFFVADFLVDHFAEPATFDIVVLNRFLTCLPSVTDWERALGQTRALLRPGGLLYVNDFLLMSGCDHNRSRYRQGHAGGGRWGNFVVHDENGNASFIAHHHSVRELRRILAPYRPICLRRYATLSRHGHRSRMFELLAICEPRSETDG